MKSALASALGLLALAASAAAALAPRSAEPPTTAANRGRTSAARYSAQGSNTPDPGRANADWTLLHCGTLLARADGEPRRAVTLVVQGERVHSIRQGFVAPAELDLPEGARVAVVDLRERTVLPGLIDCHTHVTGELSPDRRLRQVEESDADAAIRATVFARRTLLAGFTTIRNVGSAEDAAFALRDAIAAGWVPGPRILVAGESISPSGGHSDGTHRYRDDLFAVPDAFQGIADGVAECRKAVRLQVKRGADVIKLTATGGVLSATAAGTDRQFFDDELAAIVDTAHLLGRKVAAHAHGAAGIAAALRAGVDSIEHGSFSDDECLALFTETGAYLVPTLMAGAFVAEKAREGGWFPLPVKAKALHVGPVMQDMLRRAHAAGVKIAFGTDSGVSPHGRNAEELALMVAAGMTPREALVAATLNAADLCGLASEIGALEPGMAADVIAVAGDPLADVTELERVHFVMRAGTIHRQE